MAENKNRLEIRLDPDSLELLNSLIARTSLTKTSLIKKALFVYASALKNGHIYTIKIKGEPISEKKSHDEEISDEEWNKTLEELDKMPKKFDD